MPPPIQPGNLIHSHPLTSILCFLAVLLVAGCSSEPSAQEIVDRAIAAHGMEILDNAVVSFDFRGKQYRVMRDGGRFRYTKSYADTTGAQVVEVLSNDSLYRAVNGEIVTLPEDKLVGISEGVNGPIYFGLLPYFLNDPAAQKAYLGEDEVAGEPYDLVQVTFVPEGGGKDWEDRFVYWFHRDRHTMDYLAYSFTVNDGGTRFRKAVNPRTVGGLRIVDFLNYTADTLGTALERYGDMADADSLRLLSEIKMENVEVKRLPD